MGSANLVTPRLNIKLEHRYTMARARLGLGQGCDQSKLELEALNRASPAELCSYPELPQLATLATYLPVSGEAITSADHRKNL